MRKAFLVAILVAVAGVSFFQNLKLRMTAHYHGVLISSSTNSPVLANWPSAGNFLKALASTVGNAFG